MRTFFNVDEFFPKSNHHVELDRIQAEFNCQLPQELQDYIQFYAPLNDIEFNTVGNPIRLYGLNHLKFLQEGYNFDSAQQEKMTDWSDDWFIFADEGADPIILHYNQLDNVEKYYHGRGDWTASEGIAENIAQFLLCASFQHYALSQNNFDCIVDDVHGFNLHADIAAWYFPQMKKYAKQYYQTWCGVFANA